MSYSTHREQHPWLLPGEFLFFLKDIYSIRKNQTVIVKMAQVETEIQFKTCSVL